MIPAYPKIWTIGHPAVERLFIGPVCVQEKIDGSQFSFMKDAEGNLHFRSRGSEIFEASPEKMFAPAVAHVLSIRDKLAPGWVYRGEALHKPKHNTLNYARVPAGNVMLFDVGIECEKYLHLHDLKDEAAHLGLECVPLFNEFVVVQGVDEIKGYLQKESVLGGTKIEGIVVKNYGQFGKDGHVLMGKYVSEKFKEENAANWKSQKGSVMDKMIARFHTEARWEKAVQHLRERGLLENSPQDIGLLIGEAKKDFIEEERERLAHMLFKEMADQVVRGVMAGCAEWYKKKLLEGAFEDTTKVI